MAPPPRLRRRALERVKLDHAVVPTFALAGFRICWGARITLTDSAHCDEDTGLVLRSHMLPLRALNRRALVLQAIPALSLRVLSHANLTLPRRRETWCCWVDSNPLRCNAHLPVNNRALSKSFNRLTPRGE